MRERLAAFIREQLQVAPDSVRVRNLSRMPGGASRELWSLDVELGSPDSGDGERLELVLRCDPPGRVGEGDRGLEFRLLRAAAEAGVPVPRVHWFASRSDLLGSPFFLMERIRGESIPRRLLRDARYAKTRGVLAGQLGAILARIHAMDPTDPALAGLEACPDAVSPSHAEIERVAKGVRELAVEPHPVLDLAERWLRERAPHPARRTLVHGDYRVGNVVFDESGVRSILDWELAHAGDPVEDLGWLCVRAWRFGSDELPVGGVGTREELVRAYEAAGGDAVDPEALRFWEACGNFKLALVFIMQARVFLDGVPSVELASLGRRIAEAEEELLRLMEDAA